MKFKKISIMAFLSLVFWFANAQETPLEKESFDIINLNYPGLEKVHQAVLDKKYNEAAKELLEYYRKRSTVKHPEFNVADRAAFVGKPIEAAEQEKADNALIHKFKPHGGYGFFDYGKDIDWQYWPIKDDEIRWQLHRVTWWQSMGLAYRSSGDEKYAKEWVFQFRDWVRKNPFGHSKENDRIAWRPLEVSLRVLGLPSSFNLFVNSPNFSPAFLMEFLSSYNQQAGYILPHSTEHGNHLLFAAQSVLFAGAFFPELKNAGSWRRDGIGVLNTQIKKQIYPDGAQFELSPVYHVAAIEIFLSAYNAAKMAGLEKEFPESYLQIIERMIMATINYTFPDYNNPMFGDSFPVDKDLRIKQFANWSKIFPQNDVIKYFATDGKEGKIPSYLSKGLSTSGFYTFRNGWDKKSTVMVLKASPPGEFHAQPDNGTFELWVKGRNFTPDAGCYIYGGDAEVMRLRNAYRQTRVHSTLTLDNANMVITKAQLNKWATGKNIDILTYTNPSYSDLNHRRSVLFIDKKYFLIIDAAMGKARGNLGIHFQLKEDSNPFFDKGKNKVYTNYPDGNNLLIQYLNRDKVSLKEEEEKVSYAYRKELARPAFVYEKPKITEQPQRFISVFFPYNGNSAPDISLEENAANDYENGNLNITITVNGKKSTIAAKLF